MGATTVPFVLCLGLLQHETLRCTIIHIAEQTLWNYRYKEQDCTPFQGCTVMAISITVTSLLRALGSVDSKMGAARGHFRTERVKGLF